MKYYDVNKRSQYAIGQKCGCLTISDGPYYDKPKDSDIHRRQLFDAFCDCGKAKEGILGKLLGRENNFKYCGRDCPLYLENRPSQVQERSKKCKIGDKKNYLTVVKEAFYERKPGDHCRYKYIDVQCDCGTIKTCREDKFVRGATKSCGCIHEKREKKERSWSFLMKKFGMTKEKYEEILESQGGVCAICGSPDTKTLMTNYLFVDHCHTTGKVRGLLCNNCNFSIGGFNDDISLLKAAIEYLQKHI